MESVTSTRKCVNSAAHSCDRCGEDEAQRRGSDASLGAGSGARCGVRARGLASLSSRATVSTCVTPRARRAAWFCAASSEPRYRPGSTRCGTSSSTSSTSPSPSPPSSASSAAASPSAPSSAASPSASSGQPGIAPAPAAPTTAASPAAAPAPSACASTEGGRRGAMGARGGGVVRRWSIPRHSFSSIQVSASTRRSTVESTGRSPVSRAKSFTAKTTSQER
eukprot:scaffold67274_cov55-Phaeocystis_antarctica.AAC.1